MKKKKINHSFNLKIFISFRRKLAGNSADSLPHLPTTFMPNERFFISSYVRSLICIRFIHDSLCGDINVNAWKKKISLYSLAVITKTKYFSGRKIKRSSKYPSWAYRNMEIINYEDAKAKKWFLNVRR